MSARSKWKNVIALYDEIKIDPAKLAFSRGTASKPNATRPEPRAERATVPPLLEEVVVQLVGAPEEDGRTLLSDSV